MLRQRAATVLLGVAVLSAFALGRALPAEPRAADSFWLLTIWLVAPLVWVVADSVLSGVPQRPTKSVGRALRSLGMVLALSTLAQGAAAGLLGVLTLLVLCAELASQLGVTWHDAKTAAASARDLEQS